ncbi:MAG: RloB domain-containing protein [Ignavibacteriales bacterium]|nr:RloB domain-containing protein [Ignavibacteriales bacterium]
MAGRLRIKTEFGKRAIESESQDTKEVYIISIASEGKTEEQYFDGIHDMDTDSIVKVERLEKLEDTDTKSHPNHVLDLLEERKEHWQEHGIDPNELWMVVDRDKQNVSEEQLNSIIEKCVENGYNLALSNPTFEFWLLLHIKDSSDYNKEVLLNNDKVNKNRRFIDKELSDLLDGYNKKKIKFEKFESGINLAIKRAKVLPTENTELLNELGTSVCLLVEKIVK